MLSTAAATKANRCCCCGFRAQALGIPCEIERSRNRIMTSYSCTIAHRAEEQQEQHTQHSTQEGHRRMYTKSTRISTISCSFNPGCVLACRACPANSTPITTGDTPHENWYTMIPRVLGAFACGAGVVSAFIAPAVVRSPVQQQGGVAGRHGSSSSYSSSSSCARHAVSMGAAGAGGDSQQSRRDVITGAIIAYERRGLDCICLLGVHKQYVERGK